MLLSVGAAEALDVAIAVGLPTVGSVLYNFQVADVPNVPPVAANDNVPVVTPLQTDVKLGVKAVGLIDGALTAIVAWFEMVFDTKTATFEIAEPQAVVGTMLDKVMVLLPALVSKVAGTVNVPVLLVPATYVIVAVLALDAGEDTAYVTV